MIRYITLQMQAPAVVWERKKSRPGYGRLENGR